MITSAKLPNWRGKSILAINRGTVSHKILVKKNNKSTQLVASPRLLPKIVKYFNITDMKF